MTPYDIEPSGKETFVSKWEYLYVYWYGSLFIVNPAEKHDIEWLKQAYPGARVKREQGCWVVEKRGFKLRPAMIAFLDHLGSEGWEAVNFPDDEASGVALFKRKVGE